MDLEDLLALSVLGVGGYLFLTRKDGQVVPIQPTPPPQTRPRPGRRPKPSNIAGGIDLSDLIAQGVNFLAGLFNKDDDDVPAPPPVRRPGGGIPDNPPKPQDKPGNPIIPNPGIPPPRVNPVGYSSELITLGEAVWNKIKGYEIYVVREAQSNGLSPMMLRGMIWQESSGRPTVVSSAGAVGLMQIKPSTAGDSRFGCGRTDLYSPAQNIACGAKIMANLIRRFGFPKALSAYNAGEGNVNKGVRIYSYENRVQGFMTALGQYGNYYASVGRPVFTVAV